MASEELGTGRIIAAIGALAVAYADALLEEACRP